MISLPPGFMDNVIPLPNDSTEDIALPPESTEDVTLPPDIILPTCSAECCLSASPMSSSCHETLAKYPLIYPLSATLPVCEEQALWIMPASELGEPCRQVGQGPRNAYLCLFEGTLLGVVPLGGGGCGCVENYVMSVPLCSKHSPLLLQHASQVRVLHRLLLHVLYLFTLPPVFVWVPVSLPPRSDHWFAPHCVMMTFTCFSFPL